MFRKGFLCLFLVLITLAAMSTAAAVELNETADDIVSTSTEGTELEVNDDVSEIVESDSDASEVLSADVSDDVVREDEWKTFTELQELIENLDDNSVIKLKYNYYCDDEFAENYNAILIDKPLTIDGASHTLDGCGDSGILIIEANGVVLKNINFVNGIDNGQSGGGAYVRGVTTFDHCTFENCNATANGGAIFAAAKVTIKDTLFSNNEAGEYGGAIYACYPSSGDVSLDITGSRFEENYAMLGGAIYLSYKNEDDVFYNSVGKYFIKNTVFDFNGAAQNGGAILACQNGDILNCKFTNNYAYSCGGAIFLSDGRYDESTGAGHSFRLDVHGTSSFTGNSAERHGGAIYTNPQSSTFKPILNVYDSVVFEANSATLGGALYLRQSDSTIKEAKFKNNRAESGSAMYYGTAIDCVFEGNTEPVTKYVTIKKTKTEVTITPIPVKALYGENKYFQVLVVNTKTGAPMSGFNVKLSFYYPSGGLATSAIVTTGPDGIARYSISGLGPRNYKVVVSVSDLLNFKGTKKTSYAKISRSTFIIKAPKVKKAYRKTVKFKITVKDKATGKAFNKALLKIKVYTGKKHKTYSKKTNKKGKATLKLKKLKKGKHKVLIYADSYKSLKGYYCYDAAKKKSSIIIK
jgi:predicted outer membrane repeat protein